MPTEKQIHKLKNCSYDLSGCQAVLLLCVAIGLLPAAMQGLLVALLLAVEANDQCQSCTGVCQAHDADRD